MIIYNHTKEKGGNILMKKLLIILLHRLLNILEPKKRSTYIMQIDQWQKEMYDYKSKQEKRNKHLK